MEWSVFFFFVFIALCWGFYRRNKEECDARGDQAAEHLDPIVTNVLSTALTVVTAPFVKGKQMVKGRDNPEMDELKARQEAEVAKMSSGIDTSYKEWYEDDRCWWNQEQ